MALDWDILNEDFTSLSGWSTSTAGGSTITQVTFDGRSCAKLDFPSNSSADAAIVALDKTITIPTTCTVELCYYMERDSSEPAKYGSYCRVQNGSQDWNGMRYGRGFVGPSESRVAISSLANDRADGFYHRGIGPEDAYLGIWCIWRIVIKEETKADMWANNIKCVFDTTPKTTSATNEISLYTAANKGQRATLYIDYCKIDTTPEDYSDTALNIDGEQIVCNYSHVARTPEGDGGLYIPANDSKLKMQHKDVAGNPAICSVPLVATDNDYASKVRIYDGSAVKSLMKIST
jgi:hypothetical protein